MNSQPLGTVLVNLAQELDRLASLAAAIDRAIGRLPIATDMDGEALTALQRVDLLRQSLECLTHYAGSLAGQFNDTVVVDPVLAAEPLPLRDLARDLAGVAYPDGTALRPNNHDTYFF